MRFWGLIDRYESIIAIIGHEYIEEHVLKTRTGEWAKPMWEDLLVWMSEKVVPCMLHVYARGASNCTCYLLFSWWVVTCLTIMYSRRSENDAVGRWATFRFSDKQDAMRFEVCSCYSFHLLDSKWIYASRTKEIFDTIIDFPDSMGALHDLRVYYPNFFPNSIKLIDICWSSGLPSACRSTYESHQFFAKIVCIVLVQVIFMRQS